MKKIALFLGLLVSLTGCTLHTNTPQDVVETALNAIQNNDTWAFNAVSDAKLEDYILSDENFYPDMSHMSEGQQSFYKTIVPYIQKFDYTIDQTTIDSDNAIVDVTITNYDITECLQANQQAVIDEFESLGSTDINDYYALTTSYFESTIEQYFTLTHQISMQCILLDQQWTLHIEDPSTFIYNLFATQ